MQAVWCGGAALLRRLMSELLGKWREKGGELQRGIERKIQKAEDCELDVGRRNGGG